MRRPEHRTNSRCFGSPSARRNPDNVGLLGWHLSPLLCKRRGATRPIMTSVLSSAFRLSLMMESMREDSWVHLEEEKHSILTKKDLFWRRPSFSCFQIYCMDSFQNAIHTHTQLLGKAHLIWSRFETSWQPCNTVGKASMSPFFSWGAVKTCVHADHATRPLANYGQSKTRTQFTWLPTAWNRVAVDVTPMREAWFSKRSPVGIRV